MLLLQHATLRIFPDSAVQPIWKILSGNSDARADVWRETAPLPISDYSELTYSPRPSASRDLCIRGTDFVIYFAKVRQKICNSNYSFIKALPIECSSQFFHFRISFDVIRPRSMNVKATCRGRGGRGGGGGIGQASWGGELEYKHYITCIKLHNI